ncbi:15-hydroxyprostaglandin dehydrogenase (NAD) [Entomortierella parvispora]|uniref:15-hydroxyprostaglandin dehydrogenase (NAD) n=1 Tax=Entomortierella parvispora TaxID=205924 RepID=A0A9P3H9N3_9FUNG|nr:15-hydroxyprostaglandin dehydrogenase (NAD) [Entomortierella parvispora]
MHVQNKVAIITGAASGLGKALAERLVSKGAKVIIGDVAVKAGEVFAEELNAGKPHKVAHFVRCDVTNFEEIHALFNAADEHFGGVDIVVNNAGIAEYTSALLTNTPYGEPNDKWPRLVAINLTAVIEGTRRAIETMRVQGRGGVIVNTSSIAGLIPNPDWNTPVYTAVKFGVCGFSRSFKGNEKRQGPDHGIRVNCVAPAPADTPILDAVRDAVKNFPMVTVEKVIDAFMLVIEDDNISGDVARITPDEGIVIMGSDHF